MSILAAASNSGETDLGSIALTLVLVIIVGGLLACAIVGAVVQLRGHSDVHQVTGTLRHEVSGTLHHEMSGTVRYQVEHSGGVEHVVRLDQADRDRLDRLAAPQLPPPGNATLWREPDERQPAIYRNAAPPLPPTRESRVLDRRPSWPEIEQ